VRQLGEVLVPEFPPGGLPADTCRLFWLARSSQAKRHPSLRGQLSDKLLIGVALRSPQSVIAMSQQHLGRFHRSSSHLEEQTDQRHAIRST
jgi:hypothetical protein